MISQRNTPGFASSPLTFIASLNEQWCGLLGHVAALPGPAAAGAISMDQSVLGAQAVLERAAHTRDVTSDTWALLQTAGLGTQSSLG